MLCRYSEFTCKQPAYRPSTSQWHCNVTAAVTANVYILLRAAETFRNKLTSWIRVNTDISMAKALPRPSASDAQLHLSTPSEYELKTKVRQLRRTELFCLESTCYSH